MRYEQETLVQLQLIVAPKSEDICKLMGISRIEFLFPYLRDLLLNMDTKSSNKTAILSLNDESFLNISKYVDQINLADERYILDILADIKIKDFEIYFYTVFSGTFNEEIFHFYVKFILPIYLLETMFSNTYDNIKEILNSGEI